MNKLQVAVVGAGRLGGFHAQKLAARDDVELVAVVDPVTENRNRLAVQCRAEALEDYSSLLNRLDAAIIAAPTVLHHQIARDFLDAGVPLLVEKPLCANRAEADELVAAAQRSNVILQVGHVERFNPAFEAARATVRRPRYIDAVRTSAFTFRSTDVGVVLDVMIHDIDLVLSLVKSPVTKVEAVGVVVVGGHEDAVNARLEFESGCVANISASRVSYESIRRMQVWSDHGFAGIDFATRTATLVTPSETLRRRQYHLEKFTPQELDYQRQHFAEEHLPKRQLTFDAVDALALEVDDFIQSIRNRRLPRVTGEAGRDALAVAEQILAAVRERGIY